MTREEIKELLKECVGLYSAHRLMYEDEKVTKEWFKTLKYYDKADIYASLQRHKDGNYSRQPIVLNDLIRDLKTKLEKENADVFKAKTSCKICGRIMSYVECEEHEDKCRSVKYVMEQYKKWFKKDITASYLWSLPDYEFETKYNQLLKYIQNNTTDTREKSFITNYFGTINGDKNE